MYRIAYKPSFVRRFKRLDPRTQRLVVKQIGKLKHGRYHRSLKVHKLHGALVDFYSFSVTHGLRIIFQFSSKEIVLVEIGSHDMYK